MSTGALVPFSTVPIATATGTEPAVIHGNDRAIFLNTNDTTHGTASWTWSANWEEVRKALFSAGQAAFNLVDPLNAGNAAFSAGADASSTVTAGQTSASPTTNRVAKFLANAPDSVANRGAAYLETARAGVTGWRAGMFASVTGQLTAISDFGWDPSGAGVPVMSLTTAGALKLAAGLTVGTTTTLNAIAYTWPGSQAANRYLKTDGSGNLTWASILETLALTDLSDVTIAGQATGQILRAASASTWANSTATFPDTAVAGAVLYASATNVWSGLAIGSNTNVVLSQSGGFPSWTAQPVMSAGADASTLVTAGQGGAAPTGVRTAAFVANAPSVGGTLGIAGWILQRNSVETWRVVTPTSISGTDVATSDLSFRPTGGNAVASLTTAGALVLASSLTVQANGITVTGASTITGTLGGITTLTATTLAGTLSTASQPNVTTMAGLTSAAALATVGTIATGVWNGTVIVTTYGGTGLASYSAGDMVYYAAGTLLSKLAIGATGTMLRSTGTAPAWTSATIPATAAAGDLMYGSATNVWSSLAIGSNTNTVLGQSGGFPAWTAAPTISSGTDNDTTVTFGSGGAGPTGTRTVTNLLNSPSTGGNLGSARVVYQRAGTTLWQEGLFASFAGAASANTDYQWRDSTTTALMALSSAGALKISAGFTATTGTYSSTVSFTGGTFTTSLTSTTALATPGALGATQFSGFASTVSGASMMGFGTTNDVTLMNRAGTAVLGITANTSNVTMAGALAITGPLSGVTTVTTSGAITSTLNTGAWLVDVSGNTTALYAAMSNTGGAGVWGVDSSTGSLLPGATAYDAVMFTSNATGLSLGTNNVARFKITSAGAISMTSTLTVAGALTVNATGSVFSAGTDASTTLSIGSGGGAPTATRSAILVFNPADDNATNFGQGILRFQRAGTDVLFAGVDRSVSSSGVKTGRNDFVWSTALGSGYVAALTTAGALTIAAGITATTGTFSSQVSIATIAGIGATVLGNRTLSIGYGSTASISIINATADSATFIRDDGGAGATILNFLPANVQTFRLQSNAVTVTGTLGVSGLATFSGTTQAIAVSGVAATGTTAIAITGTTTGFQLISATNTSGAMRLGIEGSAGGALFTGAPAYATVFGSSTATSTVIGTNATANLTIASGGAATFSSTLTVTGALTVNATGSVFSAGSDASTVLTIGAGGAAPTAGRGVRYSLNTPDSGSFRGYADIEFNRASSQKWTVGLTTAVSGTMSALDDFVWATSGTVVASLTAAGAMKLAAGFTATSGTFSTTLNVTGIITGTEIDLTVAAEAATMKGIASGGGDRYFMIVRGAGNGVQFLSRNSADSLDAPLLLGATVLTSRGGLLSIHATNGIGYATGAGSTVTQITSRTTGVTLNNVCGAITLFTAAGSATPASFTFTNSTIAATDVVHITQKSGTDKYEIFVTTTAAGSCVVTFFTTGGTTSEAPVFNFIVWKAVTS